VPTITYNASNFPAQYGPLLSGPQSINVSWTELVWAAISVGKAQLQHITQYGIFSRFEMAYRIAIIYANLQETSSGSLRRSAAYNGLDPSEKGAISYFIGLTIAKLLVDRLLSVSWLMHLDVYRQQLSPVLLGKSRPDLVGTTTAGDWVVVEAKGRTNDFEASALQNAKAQTDQLTTIGGVPPNLRVAVLTYFKSGTLEVAIDDPRARNNRVSDLPLTPELILSSYYRPFQQLIRESRARKKSIQKEPYWIVPISDLDVWVGLPNRLIEPIMPLTQQLFGHIRPRRQRRNIFIGADELLVRLGPSWSSDNMILEPQERQRT
jgi:hypothetical protein